MSELIQFDGRTVAVIAPEDLEQMEAEIERLRELAYFYPAPARLPMPWSEEAARIRGELYRANLDIGTKNAQIENLREEVYAVPPTENMTGQTWREAAYANREEVARLDNLLRNIRCPHCDELRLELGESRREIERLQLELDSADRIANAWVRENIELRRLLLFFFENVPVQYHEGYAEVMKQTDEILSREDLTIA